MSHRACCARKPAFPNRPIRIVVPVAPGGGVDTFARLIAAKVKTQRDVQFIVENRTGGNSHDRRPRCPARRAGRLHGAVPRLDAQCRAAGVEERALRSGRRFHADRAGRQRAAGAHRRRTTGRRRRWPRSSPRPRPIPTSGRSRPRSSARPAISPPSRSINTTASTCRSSSIAAPRRPPTMSSAATCR